MSQQATQKPAGLTAYAGKLKLSHNRLTQIDRHYHFILSLVLMACIVYKLKACL